MARTVIRFQLNARVEWEVSRDERNGGWVAVCPALAVTAEADTWTELHEVVGEVHNELFRDLLREGQLQTFLTKHGWRPLGPLPGPSADAIFDIPSYMIPPAHDRAREVHQ